MGLMKIGGHYTEIPTYYPKSNGSEFESEAMENLEQDFIDGDSIAETWYVLGDNSKAIDALIEAHANSSLITAEMQQAVIKEIVDAVNTAKERYIDRKLDAEKKRLYDYKQECRYGI